VVAILYSTKQPPRTNKRNNGNEKICKKQTVQGLATKRCKIEVSVQESQSKETILTFKVKKVAMGQEKERCNKTC
jgi:hypothetical protein